MIRKITEEQAHSMLDDIEFSNTMFRSEIISAWKESGFIKKEKDSLSEIVRKIYKYSGNGNLDEVTAMLMEDIIAAIREQKKEGE